MFVSNLPYDFTEKELKEFVEKKGMNTTDVYIVKNPDKTSKGFGYIRFETDKEAKVAL